MSDLSDEKLAAWWKDAQDDYRMTEFSHETLHDRILALLKALADCQELKHIQDEQYQHSWTTARTELARAETALEALGKERNTWARQLADLRDELDEVREKLADSRAEAAQIDQDRTLAQVRAETSVLDFAQWVSTNRAYNGSRHQNGQSLYNESINAVLPRWAEEFLRTNDG